MKLVNNVLLVDDERRWREIYERAVRQVGLDKVQIAENLADAKTAVDAMRFAVALIDIGLQVDDDRNVDGLRIMEKIRSAGDETSIIVITGRSGRDVVPIIRDAMKKYDAHDTVAKSTLLPAQLRNLVESGLRAYKEAASDDRGPLYEAMRGDVQPHIWDDIMMRDVAIEGGAAGLYRIVEAVFGPYWPLVVGHPKGVQKRDGIACGVFWSRAIGEAIVGCFGQRTRIQSAMERARDDGRLLGIYPVGEVLMEYPASSAHGVVYSLAGSIRGDFAGVGD